MRVPNGWYYGWVMVASAFAINVFLSPVSPVVFSFFIDPMSEDLGVGAGALSWALTLRLAAGGVTGPFIGVLIDRYGARWLGAAAGALAGAMLIALSQANSLWVVYVIFALSGLFGLGGPAGQLLTQVPLAKWFVTKRARAMAIATTGLPGGAAMLIPVTQWLIDELGWRDAWIVLGGIVAAIVVPVSIIFVRRAPEDLGLLPDGRAPAPERERTAPVSMIATDVDWTAREALRTPAMWAVLTALGLAGLGLTGTLVHRVHFWEDTGMSPNIVALGIAVDPLAVIFSAIGFGLLGDRVPTRYIGFAGLMGMSVSMLPMILTSGQAYTLFLHSIGWGAAAGAYITVNNIIWPNYFGRRFLGAIRGIALPVSIIASGFGAPLYGYLFDEGVDPAAIWTTTLVLFAAGALLLLGARPPQRAPAVVAGRSDAVA